MELNVELQQKFKTHFLKQAGKTNEFSSLLANTDGFKNATITDAREMAKLMINFIFVTPLVNGQLYYFQDESKKTLLIFTSQEEQQNYTDKCIKNGNVDWYYFDNDELLNIVCEDESVVAQVNVLGETFAFNHHNLIAILQEYVYSNMIGKGDYMTGIPQNPPVDFLNELSSEFANDPGIMEARLYQSAFIGSDNQYKNHMVIVIDMPLPYYIHVEEFIYLMANAYNLDGQIMVAFAESDYGKMLLETPIEPFYKK